MQLFIFMGLDLFGEPLPGLKLYGNEQRNFYQDEDFLNQRMVKVYSRYWKASEKCPHHTPVLAMINLETFQRSLIAVEDHGSAYPQSWLFVPKRKYWADAFVVCMNHDIDVT